MRTKVFISYSHDDDRWRKRLVSHLNVVARQGLIEVWDDRKLHAGEAWRERIDGEMLQARIAVLLLSSSFLTSDFILDEEVPQLFARHEAAGMTIYPLLIKPCPWKEVSWLARMQLRPQEGRSVASFRGAKVDEVLVAAASEIADIARDERSAKRIRISSDDWKRLAPSEFTIFCTDLLRSFGFSNVHVLDGAHDRGSDIFCERTVELGPNIRATLVWIVQCKHSLNGLTKHSIRKDLTKALEHRVDFWWLLTTAQLTPGLFDWLRVVGRNEFPFRVDCLDRPILERALLDRPRMLGKYFSHKLTSGEQPWAAVMGTMSNGEYEDALRVLREHERDKHPRTFYLIACCLSMIARHHHKKASIDGAFRYLKMAEDGGYVSYMHSLVGWPKEKCVTQIRSDPELAFLRQVDPERFAGLFGPPTSDGADNCLELQTPVMLDDGSSCPVSSLHAGRRLITDLGPPVEVGEISTIDRVEISGSVSLNSAVTCALNHRFFTAAGWRRAGELLIGDLVAAQDGWRVVSSVEYSERRMEVCKLAIRGTPHYYANGYLVHNDK